MCKVTRLRRPYHGSGLIPGQSVWDLWWTKWHWDRFFPEYLVFRCQFHSTGALLLGKVKRTDHISLQLHHRAAQKPQGCCASVASAADPFSIKKSRLRTGQPRSCYSIPGTGKISFYFAKHPYRSDGPPGLVLTAYRVLFLPGKS
jgi:hypothetical protein